MKTQLPLRLRLARSLSLITALAAVPAIADDGDPAHAQFIKSCGVCHTTEKGAELRQGPNLGSVFGRPAGTLAEFPEYSDALKKAGAGGLVWNDETLDKWLTGPSDFVAGVKMFYAQPDPEKRKLIISYLKGLSGGAK